MSIQVNNTDNQLNIIVNGVLDVYNVKTIKSVSRAVDASGNNYISINFIANDKNNYNFNLIYLSNTAPHHRIKLHKLSTTTHQRLNAS